MQTALVQGAGWGHPDPGHPTTAAQLQQQGLVEGAGDPTRLRVPVPSESQICRAAQDPGVAGGYIVRGKILEADPRSEYPCLLPEQARWGLTAHSGLSVAS